MTAEERLAYFQGEKRRSSSYVEQKRERNFDKLFFKLKFIVAIILLVGFLSMDYTGYQVNGIDSEKIINEVTKDCAFLKELNL